MKLFLVAAIAPAAMIPAAGAEPNRDTRSAVSAAGPTGRIVFASAGDPELNAEDGVGPRIFRADLTGKRTLLQFGHQPVLAPDGKTILFYSSGNDSISRTSVDGGDARPLVRGKSPTWSPDGKRIAFDAGGRLLTVAASGKQSRTIAVGPGVQRPTWSPDGRWIAYVDRGGVAAVRPDGTAKRRLFATTAVTSAISWSPDGKRVTFSASVRQPSGSISAAAIVVAQAQGVPARSLTAGNSDSAPEWSPDGRRIVFVRSGRILTVSATSGRVTVMTRPPAGSSDSRPSWSPDGSSIVFARGSSPWVVPASGGRAKPVRREDAQAVLGPESFRWLPDGRSFLYTLELNQSDPEIYSIGADGRGRKRLTSNHVDDLFPRSSPDGQWIVFERYRSDSSEGIFLMRSDGSSVRRLTSDGDSPSWSPDGSRIMFVREASGGFLLYTMWLDGTHVRPVPNSILPSFDDVAWSPDGRSYAWVDQGFLGVTRLGREPDLEATIWDPVAFGPAWHPSGDLLAFGLTDPVGEDEEDDAVSAVYTSRPDGSGVRKLVADAANPAWSPDGQHLAVIRALPRDEASYTTLRRTTLMIVTASGEPIRVLEGAFALNTLSWQPRCNRTGGTRADRLESLPAGGLVCGLGGNDIIVGGPGPDRLFGQEGGDSIDARGGGFDVVGCGSGRDTVQADEADLVGVDCEQVQRS